MIEEKIEQLKENIDNNTKNKELNKKEKINTKIDLNIEAYIDDDFFSSELDKINFYREIETIENLRDLNDIIEDFKQINKNI
jgi:transcription-repair coupling factor (superfamily II helicase)